MKTRIHRLTISLSAFQPSVALGLIIVTGVLLIWGYFALAEEISHQTHRSIRLYKAPWVLMAWAALIYFYVIPMFRAYRLFLRWHEVAVEGFIPEDNLEPDLSPLKGINLSLSRRRRLKYWNDAHEWANMDSVQAKHLFEKALIDLIWALPLFVLGIIFAFQAKAGHYDIYRSLGFFLGMAVAIGSIGFYAYRNHKNLGNSAYWGGEKIRKKREHEIKTRKAYGAAGWAQGVDLENIVGQEGIYVGANRHWNKKGHILTVGSNRAGKGANLIIPNLLSSRFHQSDSSFICLDPKGENAAVTARAVRQGGYDVHVLNPFGVGNLPSSSFNPFDLTSSEDKDVVDFCDLMAEMVIPYHPNSNATNDHFDTQARALLSAFMLHMIGSKPKAEVNFTTLFKWANLSGNSLDKLFTEMSLSETNNGLVGSIVSGFLETRLGGGEKETSGIMSTMKKGLSPFKNPHLQRTTEKSDFDFGDIVHRKVGIYVCLQQYQMMANAVWLRLIIASSLKYLQKHYNKNRRVLYILDEFPTLGYVREIEQNMGFIAGFNVTFWVILQSLAQLKTNYPNSWEVFTSNALVKHFIKVGDLTTAEYVSNIMPMDVIMLPDGQGNERAERKKLLTPEQVMAKDGIITMFSELDRPILFKEHRYYSSEHFKHLADPNPFI